MGIDRIGKPTAPANLDAISGPSAVSKEPFEVHKASDVSKTEASSSLDRLNAGEIDFEQYLDLQVQEATGHLVGRLPAEQLSFIQSNLRAQLETDPMLVDLANRAAGSRARTGQGG